MPHRTWYVVGALGILTTLVVFLYRTEPTFVLATFGDTSLIVQYVTEKIDQERGLGGRDSVPSHYGMLFGFSKNDTYGFWMKDMKVPIDIFWLDEGGQVIFIRENVATSTFPEIFYPDAPARYVLETAAGFAEEYGIATGTPLELKNLRPISE